MNKANKYWILFSSTFAISALTSGGYVIVSMMRKKFVDQLHWLEEEEMLDLHRSIYTRASRSQCFHFGRLSHWWFRRCTAHHVGNHNAAAHYHVCRCRMLSSLLQ